MIATECRRPSKSASNERRSWPLGAARKTALLASGENYPDALAAGSISFSQHFPILLTRKDSLPSETKSALTALGIQHVVVVGGTGAIGSAVLTAVTGTGASVERVSGADRYDTAAQLADFALAKLPGWSTAFVVR